MKTLGWATSNMYAWESLEACGALPVLELSGASSETRLSSPGPSAGPIAYHVDVSQRPVQLYVHTPVVTSPPLLSAALFSLHIASLYCCISSLSSAVCACLLHGLSVTLVAFAQQSLLLCAPAFSLAVDTVAHTSPHQFLLLFGPELGPDRVQANSLSAAVSAVLRLHLSIALRGRGDRCRLTYRPRVAENQARIIMHTYAQ